MVNNIEKFENIYGNNKETEIIKERDNYNNDLVSWERSMKEFLNTPVGQTVNALADIAIKIKGPDFTNASFIDREKKLVGYDLDSVRITTDMKSTNIRIHFEDGEILIPNAKESIYGISEFIQNFNKGAPKKAKVENFLNSYFYNHLSQFVEIRTSDDTRIEAFFCNHEFWNYFRITKHNTISVQEAFGDLGSTYPEYFGDLGITYPEYKKIIPALNYVSEMEDAKNFINLHAYVKMRSINSLSENPMDINVVELNIRGYESSQEICSFKKIVDFIEVGREGFIALPNITQEDLGNIIHDIRVAGEMGPVSLKIAKEIADMHVEKAEVITKDSTLNEEKNLNNDDLDK